METGTPEQMSVLLLDEHRKMAFSIVSLAFKNDTWRLSDGAGKVHVAIADTNFLKRVNSDQISLSKGDVLVCSVRTRQWQTIDSVKTEYAVTDVLEHRPAARQLPLPGL